MHASATSRTGRRLARRSARKAVFAAASALYAIAGVPAAFAGGAVFGVALLCAHEVVRADLNKEQPPVETGIVARDIEPIGHRQLGNEYGVLRQAGVDEQEYARIIAITTLMGQKHVIDEREIRFIRDPRYPGTALEQFADLFGRAILEQRSPRFGPTTPEEAALLYSGG